MKVKFGALLVDGRGKIGGQVLSRNRGGAYMRTKVTPLNPQTARQTAVRQLFTAFAQSFRTLTQAQIAAWNSAVDNFKKTDIFGDLKKPTGENLYIGLNMNLVQNGGSVILAPPALASSPDVAEVTATANSVTPSLSLAFAPSPVPAGFAIQVEATAQVSPGVNFVKNRFRYLETLAPAAATPSNILTIYTAKFGTLSAGQKIFFRVKMIDLTTGVAGQSSVSSCIVS